MRAERGAALRERQHPIDRRLDRTQEDIGQHAHQDGDRDDRDEDRPFAAAQIGHRRVRFIRDLAVVDALEHPEHVGRRENDAGGGERRHPRIGAERAEQDQELADEAVEAGQSDRRQRDEEKGRDEVRHHALEAAVLRDEARVAPVRQHPDDQEEPAGADAVVQHLIHGALHPLRVHRRDAEDDESKMADARVRDELLHVGLHHRDERAVDDADDRQQRQPRRERRGGRGKERKREADEPVGAHLQQHARQNHRARGRRLDVRVGQPRVERKERHLDREREREGEEEPELHPLGNRERVHPQQIEAVGAVRRVVHVREAQDREQHEHAARHRVQDELHGRIHAPVVAPDPDQEVHRHQHRVPEHVEQEQVERDEDADHRRLEQQHEDAERLQPLVNRLPRAEERERRQQPREDEQKQADAVDADEIRDAERRNPRVPLDELEVGGRCIEAAPQKQRFGEDQRRHDERHVPNRRRMRVVFLDREEENGANDRQDDQRRKNRERHQRLLDTTSVFIATSNTPAPTPRRAAATPRTRAPNPSARGGAPRWRRQPFRRRRSPRRR